MNLDEAIHYMIDNHIEATDYFDGLRKITQLTNHFPLGFIWVDPDSTARPGEIGIHYVEWLPFDNDVPPQELVIFFELLTAIIKQKIIDREDDDYSVFDNSEE